MGNELTAYHIVQGQLLLRLPDCRTIFAEKIFPALKKSAAEEGQFGAVDGAEGECRRVGDSEGDLDVDGVASARRGYGGGRIVAAAAHVRYRVEQDPAGKPEQPEVEVEAEAAGLGMVGRREAAADGGMGRRDASGGAGEARD